jgi:hypothetical protein
LRQSGGSQVRTVNLQVAEFVSVFMRALLEQGSPLLHIPQVFDVVHSIQCLAQCAVR